jgi:hypothetical protein
LSTELNIVITQSFYFVKTFFLGFDVAAINNINAPPPSATGIHGKPPPSEGVGPGGGGVPPLVFTSISVEPSNTQSSCTGIGLTTMLVEPSSTQPAGALAVLTLTLLEPSKAQSLILITRVEVQEENLHTQTT